MISSVAIFWTIYPSGLTGHAFIRSAGNGTKTSFPAGRIANFAAENFLPVVKAIGGNQAAPLVKGLIDMTVPCQWFRPSR
jgi:hypothetical protein